MATWIYRGQDGTPILTAETPNVLDCISSKEFWISWEDGKIEVRQHSASGRTLASWQDNEAEEIHQIALSSGTGSDGAEWVTTMSAGQLDLINLE